MGIFKYGGGKDGIVEYLEEGKKQGREFTRDQLDTRIVLDGDLKKTGAIIDNMERDGERYNHITFSFKEDEISENDLKAITADIKKYLLAAYGDNEIDFYAEAHIPKIKSYIDQKTMKVVERKPHIHIVIPTINMVTGDRASPLELLQAKYGTKDQTMDMLDAIQEHINAKYGLASPKDNRRTDFTSASEIIARQKGDDFSGKNKVMLQTISDRMIDEKIETREDFKAMLRTIGAVSEGKGGEYLQVRPHGERQNVRLKDYQFTDEFIIKPTSEKLAYIQAERQDKAYLVAQASRPTAEEHTRLLKKWEQRAKEIKYISPSSKFFTDTYSKLAAPEKMKVLVMLENEHYKQLKENNGYDRTTGAISAGAGERHAHGRRDGVLHAVRRNLSEASRNFSHVANNTGLTADAVRGAVESTGKTSVADERAKRLSSIVSRGRDIGASELKDGELNADRLRNHHANIAANLKAADHAFSLVDADSRSIFDAAQAGRANLADNAYSHRLAAWSNGRINSIYLRTSDEIRVADKAGAGIVKEPETVIKALTFSQSSFSARQLETYLLKNTSSPEQYENALEAVLKSSELVTQKNDKGDRFSSKEIIKIESQLIATVERLAKNNTAAVPESLQQEIIASKTFNDGQEAAFKLLCGEDQIAVVNGAAGTGKSYVLGAMREAYEDQGFNVYGAILQGKTAEDLERDSGIQSQTMHSFLYALDTGKIQLNEKSVVVTDEAGMVGSRQMDKLTAHVENAGAKLRLVGDKNQLSSVEYGNAFDEISKRCKVAKLTDIKRQNEPWQKAASEQFADLKIAAGLAAYAEHGCIKEHDTQLEAMVDLVDHWSKYRREHPEKTQIVLVATNEERNHLNKLMRDRIKSEGGLTTEHSIKTGEFTSIKAAAGDKMMFMAPDKNLGVKNGSIGTIEEINTDITKITLENGKSITLDNSAETSIDYAYAATVHKSQGMTVDNALVLASKNMNAENIYVAMTRHRDSVTMFYSEEKFAAEAGKTFYKTLVDSLSQSGTKEFTANGKAWSDTTRKDDSLVSQLIADHNSNAVLASAANDANYRELKQNLQAGRVLDRLSKTHGIQPDLYPVVKADDGSDRIQVGNKVMDVAAFLTKKVGMSYNTEALPMMKECYSDQLKNVYSFKAPTNDLSADKALIAAYADFRKVREADYREAKAAIDAAARSSKEEVRITADNSQERTAGIKAISQEARELKATLKQDYEKPSAEVYKDFVARRAMQGIQDSLEELERRTVTEADKTRLATIQAALEQQQRDAREEAITAFEAAEQRRTDTANKDNQQAKDDEAKDAIEISSMSELPTGVELEYTGSSEEFASFEVVEKDSAKHHQEHRKTFVMPLTPALKEKLFAAKLDKGDKFKVDQKSESKAAEKKLDEQIKKIKI